MPNIQPPPSPQSQVGEIEWGVPKQANLSQFCYVPNSLGREGVRKLWNNIPKYARFSLSIP